ncbi:MAG: hypothetical protein ACXVCM_09105 [Ktedonobacteraceae bacterium]
MNMQHYEVQIWKTENRIADNGAEDYKGYFDADTAADAAKQLVQEMHVSGKFYVEVRIKDNKLDCWKFTDMSPELNS